MARRRCLKSVVHNFLGTFASRYSDHAGYWIFGMLVADLNRHAVDLLGAELDGKDALTTTDLIAQRRFHEQVMKAGLAVSCIREARLELHRTERSATVFVNGLAATGYELTLTARLVSDLGRTYESTKSIFVAPHDPEIEQRSTRADS